MNKIKCAKCGSDKLRVLDTKRSKPSDVKSRQYICKACGYGSRYVQLPTLPKLKVIKSGAKYPDRKGLLQEFSWRKLLNSIAYAMERPPRHREVADVALEVLGRIQTESHELEDDSPSRCISSKSIGEFVLHELLSRGDYDSAIKYFSYFRHRNNERSPMNKAIEDLDDVKQMVKEAEDSRQRDQEQATAIRVSETSKMPE